METILNFFRQLPQVDAVLPRAVLNTLMVPALIYVTGLMITLINNLICGIIAGIIGDRAAGVTRNYLTYPGTVHHELAHALLALLTGARVVQINLKPHGNTLGSVTLIPRGNFITKSIQLALSAIAPVLCGFITLTLMTVYAYPVCITWWQFAIFGYFFLSVLFHMNLSPQDVHNAFHGLPVVMLILFVIFLFVRVNLLQVVIQFIQSIPSYFKL